MTLSALLVCVEEAAAAVLHRVLEELSIQVEPCPDFARAAIRLAQDRFDVVIVDGASNAEVISLLRDTRLSRTNDATLAVAVVSGQEAIREMFSLGVNFVLYKPVEYERALSSLRAARSVMRKEKRKNARAAVHAHATVDYANVQQEQATLVNLARDGMLVRFGKKVPPAGKVYFQFQLPEQTSTIRLSGQVVWQEWSGRAGVQFADVPKASRRLLDEFLSAHLRTATEQERLSEVAVEIDDQLQLAAVAAQEPAQRTQKAVLREVQALPEAVESSDIVAEEPSGQDNRRTEKRYSCRLGAEVYRTGTAIPNHCCLTDLSSGGCYLEVSIPFPQGESVVIVVRTYEMKLRLRGTVQTSHPSYGMGVAFELKTQEECDQVKKLTDFVAATSK